MEKILDLVQADLGIDIVIESPIEEVTDSVT